MGKIYQTSETAEEDFLKTNWYKAGYDKTLNAFLKVIKELNYQVIFINEEFRELSIENSKVKANVSIFEYSPFETSIDLVVESKSVLKGSNAKNAIIELMDKMKQNLEFKGVSLHI